MALLKKKKSAWTKIAPKRKGKRHKYQGNGGVWLDATYVRLAPIIGFSGFHHTGLQQALASLHRNIAERHP